MSQPWAKKLYNSKEWKKCRKAYIESVHGMCERCMSKGKYNPGYIVHHKTWLTIANIDDPNITLNHNNLYYICKDCHEVEHHGEKEVVREGLYFNENGELVQG